MVVNNAADGVFLKSSDGTDIFASAVGNPSNPAIVFVHGSTYSAAVYDDILKDERLLSKYYMITFDMRGHGRSGMPNTMEAYASKLFADDFATVITHFKVKSPLYAGWSYGGSMATDICSYLPPQTISGIFSIAGIPATHLCVPNPLSKNFPSLFGVKDDIPVYINAKAAFMDDCFNEPFNVPVRMRWSWLGSAILQPPAIYTFHLIRTQDATKLFEAGAQGLPYLALSGTADKLLSNDKITAFLQPHFKNLEVHEIQGGSHALFIEHKDEFIDVLISFADKVLKK